jgi:hypothetical protein
MRRNEADLDAELAHCEAGHAEGILPVRDVTFSSDDLEGIDESFRGLNLEGKS